MEEKKQDYQIDIKKFEWGLTDASYLAGFISGLKSLGIFTEQSLKEFVLNKVYMEYQKELHQMSLESEEYVAKIYSKTPIRLATDEDDDEE